VLDQADKQNRTERKGTGESSKSRAEERSFFAKRDFKFGKEQARLVGFVGQQCWQEPE